MTAEEAAKLITAIADALRSKPFQFTANVNIGTAATSYGDGPAISASASHGGIGYVSQAGTGEMTMPGQAYREQEMRDVADALQELAEAVTAEDKSRVKKVLGALRRNKDVPTSILAGAEAAVELAHLIAG